METKEFQFKGLVLNGIMMLILTLLVPLAASRSLSMLPCMKSSGLPLLGGYC